MEPCTMPSLGGKAVPSSQCGCARTTVPVEMPYREHAFETTFAPAPQGVPLMAPVIALAFAAVVFARQRRPSTIVQLHLARPSVRFERAPWRLPRLVLSEKERRALARLGGFAAALRGRMRPPAVAVPAPVAAYSHPRLRNQ